LFEYNKRVEWAWNSAIPLLWGETCQTHVF